MRLKKNNKEGDEDTMEYYIAKLVDLFYSEQFCFYRWVVSAGGTARLVLLSRGQTQPATKGLDLV